MTLNLVFPKKELNIIAINPFLDPFVRKTGSFPNLVITQIIDFHSQHRAFTYIRYNSLCYLCLTQTEERIQQKSYFLATLSCNYVRNIQKKRSGDTAEITLLIPGPVGENDGTKRLLFY